MQYYIFHTVVLGKVYAFGYLNIFLTVELRYDVEFVL